MIRRTLLSLVFVPLAVACGSSPSPEDASGPRTITGTLALSSYVLDNPVVIARASNGMSYVAPVHSNGAFRLVVPSELRYRMVIASTQRDGSFRAVSEIRWGTERATWGRFASASAALDLGSVHPEGRSNAKTQSSGSGKDGSGSDSSGYGSGSAESSGGGGDADGEAAEADDCYKPGRADLPYDARPGVGDTWKLLDAFLEKGPAPASVISVKMDGGGSWRLAELQSGVPFVITQADCDHEGNRGAGRDRIFVTWRNADGSEETDHLDMRYCKGGGGGGGGGSSSSTAATGACDEGDAPVCGGSSMGSSECDGATMYPAPSEPGDDGALPPCAGSTPGSSTGGSDGTTAPPSGGGAGGSASDSASEPPSGGGAGGSAGGAGSACMTSSECGAGYSCFASTCIAAPR